ncbi:MAG TPA: hypothetical protein VGL93_23860 [Streptosporangiaceae bacterium]
MPHHAPPDFPGPPDDLRPAQLGVVLLGRVTSGQLAVTLVDLDRRGHLRIDEIIGVPPDWSLTRTGGDDALLPYEQALLGGVCADHERRLSELGAGLAPTLKRVRARLLRDAIRRGDLRRWRRRRTESGDRLVPVITAYRRELRRLRSVRGEAALDPYLPYALLFGIGPGAARSARARADRHRLADFAAAWVAACAGIAGWAAEHDTAGEVDTWSRDQFGGMPNGGGSI